MVLLSDYARLAVRVQRLKDVAQKGRAVNPLTSASNLNAAVGTAVTMPTIVPRAMRHIATPAFPQSVEPLRDFSSSTSSCRSWWARGLMRHPGANLGRLPAVGCRNGQGLPVNLEGSRIGPSVDLDVDRMARHWHLTSGKRLPGSDEAYQFEGCETTSDSCFAHSDDGSRLALSLSFL